MYRHLYVIKTPSEMMMLNRNLELYDMEVIEGVVPYDINYIDVGMNELVRRYKEEGMDVSKEIEHRLGHVLESYRAFIRRKSHYLSFDEVKLACNDAFLDAIRQYDFRQGNFISYFRCVLKTSMAKVRTNYVRDHFKCMKRKAFLVPLDEACAPSHCSYYLNEYTTQEERYRSIAERVDIQDYMEMLSPTDRDILNLLIKGFKVSEISRIIGRKYQYTRHRIKRMRRELHLRRILEKEC